MDKTLSKFLPGRLALLFILATFLLVGCGTSSSIVSPEDEARGDVSAEYADLEQLAPVFSSAALIIKFDLSRQEEIVETLVGNAAGVEGMNLALSIPGFAPVQDILFGLDLENLDRTSPAYFVLSTGGNDEFMAAWREQEGRGAVEVPRFVHLRLVFGSQSTAAALREEIERHLPDSWQAHEYAGRVVVDGLVVLTESEGLDPAPARTELSAVDTEATLKPTPALRAFAHAETPMTMYVNTARLRELLAIIEASPSFYRLLDDRTLEYIDAAIMTHVDGDEVRGEIIATRSPLGERLAREISRDLPGLPELPAQYEARAILTMEGTANLGLARLLVPTAGWVMNERGTREDAQRLQSQLRDVAWLIQLTQPVVYWSMFSTGEDPTPLAIRFAAYDGEESSPYALAAVFEHTPHARFMLEKYFSDSRDQQWRLDVEGEHLVLLLTRHLELADAFPLGTQRSTPPRLVMVMRPSEIKKWHPKDRPRYLRMLPIDKVDFGIPAMGLVVVPYEDHTLITIGTVQP
ncbi:MAG: hypothetical protein ACNA8W_05625 [Bradymonadaceae bacterium]